MKKQRICGYVTLLVVSLATGCAQKSSEIDSKELVTQRTEVSIEKSTEVLTLNNEDIMKFPAQYTKEEGTVHFNTKVLAGNEGKVKALSVYHVQPIKVSHDDVYNCFFSQTELKDTQILDRKNEDGSAGIAYYYHGKQGENLSILETSFRYYSPFAFQLLNSFSLEKGEDGYNADLYQRNKDFAFSNHEEALKQVLEQMNTVGLKMENDTYGYQCYSLDYQTLEKEESIINMDGNQDTENYKDSWSEDDNCYYFCIRQKIDDIPVTYEYAGAFGNYNDANAPIQAVISKDGIKMLTFDKLFQITETSEKVTLLDFEEIANCVKDKYGDLLTNSTYDAEQAELVYIALKQPQGGYEMKPIWVFDIIEKADGMAEGYLLQMMVDAQSGEEVVL